MGWAFDVAIVGAVVAIVVGLVGAKSGIWMPWVGWAREATAGRMDAVALAAEEAAAPEVVLDFKGRGVRPVGPIRSLLREFKIAAVAGPGVGNKVLASVPKSELWRNGDSGPGRMAFAVAMAAAVGVLLIFVLLMLVVATMGLVEEVFNGADPAKLSKEEDKPEVDACCGAGPWSIAGERGPERKESDHPGLPGFFAFGKADEGSVDEMEDIGGSTRRLSGLRNWLLLEKREG